MYIFNILCKMLFIYNSFIFLIDFSTDKYKLENFILCLLFTKKEYEV